MELLSDIKTWQTNRADRPKEEGPNKNKQNTKLGSLMNVMRFFPHFFFFSFVKETKPSALHHVKKQKQKKKRQIPNWISRQRPKICSNPIRMICISNLPAIKCLCLSKQELPRYFLSFSCIVYCTHTSVPFFIDVFFLAFLDT